MSKTSDERPATAAALIYRELTSPRDVLALLRLRHRIYFRERNYGSPKPYELDLTTHEAHARLFGVFRGPRLVGGLRVVFRGEQTLAPVVRTLHALVHDAPEPTPRSLPSEEAFDLSTALGSRAGLVDVEVGRLVVVHSELGTGTVRELMIATLGALLLVGCRYYLYSCALELAARYARVTHPRWTLPSPFAEGIGSDGFPFPRQSVAAVAAVEDSPYLDRALAHASALRTSGFTALASQATARAGERNDSDG